jgi:chromosome segregation ATPase
LQTALASSNPLTNRITKRARVSETARRAMMKGRRNMASMLFDTQKMVEHWESTGVPSEHARAHTAVLAEGLNALEAAIVERCASKEDLRKLEAKLDARMDRLQSQIDINAADMNAKFAEVKAEFANMNAKLAEINARFAETDAKIANLRSELIRWMVTVGILQTALITALVLKLAA